MEGVQADELHGGVGRAYELMQCCGRGRSGYKLMSCVAAWKGGTYKMMHDGWRQCEVGVRSDVVAGLVN